MTAETKARAACLIGWPAAHSRSPLIHHYWLRKLGIAGGYTIEAVPPEDLAAFVLNLGGHGFVGANVTMPHKGRAPAAAPTRSGTTAANCARPIPTSRASSEISTPARRDGTQPKLRWCWAP